MENELFFFVLDDDDDFLQVIAMHLQDIGHNHFRCFNCEKDMMPEISKDFPSIIILDFNLKHIKTGLDVMFDVRSINKKCKFIFMSSLISIDNLTLINNSGCGYFINKTKDFYSELEKSLGIAKGQIESEQAKEEARKKNAAKLNETIDKTLQILESGYD